ncbi:MAG: VOC family protein [Kofleriaceae bacterium]|nr:VOC family protein [Myxococcales bacterium]MCB9565513.1 VOC family protein [Kofleriaceae bacterium]
MPAPILATALVYACDLDRLLAFYRDGLGLPVRERADGWAVLGDGGATLALHAIPAAIAATIELATPPVRRDDTPIKLIFTTTDLAATRARLEAHGAIMDPPRDPRRCDGVDPEGNVFQIAAPAQ